MKKNNYFDVLIIKDELDSVDMIQVMMKDKCCGVFYENDSAQLYFNQGFKESINRELVQLFPERSLEWEWGIQNNEDWHLTWQDKFKEILIDNKLAIIPPWQQRCSADLVVKIKPGMAFGTGHHETTWLMLTQMMKYIQPGMSILDFGAGSGILSIAAIKMGAINVDAVENDPECKINFYENLYLNRIKQNIKFHDKDILNWNQFNYDLILANINWQVIKEMLPSLKSSCIKILLSGLLEVDFENMEELCHENKYEIKEKMIKGEWGCYFINLNG